MIVLFFLLSPLFILFILICLKIKRKHELLKTFNDNKKAIDNANLSSNYKLGSGHLYS